MTAERGIVIVTGSSGSIGDAVMRRFAGQFEHVVGFDRQAPAPPPPVCVAVPVDITSEKSVMDGLRTIHAHHGAHVASVIHLAAYYDFLGAPSPKYDEITVSGTARLLHGPVEPGQLITEDSPLAPPRGWSYNPSSWPQRAPIIALALVGFFLSRQMTAFQLTHIASLADPFFGLGTERVLTSDVSRAFPIPDAGLGAVAYMIEFLMGFMGDKARWRTMPWMVTFFGILVVPLGVVSVTLIILQPVAVGAWCTPCLIAAAAMLAMISLTLDEVVATLQFLVQARRERQPLWQVFWMGGVLREAPDATPAQIRADVVSPMAMLWGAALPWNLMVTVALGLWLMAAPSALGSIGMAAHSDHVIGALIVTVVMIALADVGRAARFVNVLLATVVIVAPWVVDGATVSARWNDLIVGVVVVLLAVRRGPVRERYGSYEGWIR